MKKELDYFTIDGAPGGNQDWFHDPMMRLGGCAAVCACDSSIYFARARGVAGIYPFDASALTKRDYVRFSRVMKPYLRPRREGVDKIETYMDGFRQYLCDRGADSISMTALPGDSTAKEAKAAIADSIDAGLPLPCLILNHSNKAFEDYEWHWFMLTGYDAGESCFLVKAVTYGGWEWLNLEDLWHTGATRRGGLVLYDNV